MKQTFTIAGLAAAVFAAPTSKPTLKQDRKFQEHCAKWNERIEDTAVYEKKQKLYHETDELIRNVNAKADRNPDPQALRLKHNKFSTMTKEEKESWMGLRNNNNEMAEKIAKLPMGKAKGHGRGLNS